jgi:hypothetical protein
LVDSGTPKVNNLVDVLPLSVFVTFESFSLCLCHPHNDKEGAGAPPPPLLPLPMARTKAHQGHSTDRIVAKVAANIPIRTSLLPVATLPYKDSSNKESQQQRDYVSTFVEEYQDTAL